MKHSILTTAMVLAAVAGEALALCETSTRMTTSALTAFLPGKLVCGRPAAGYPGGVGSTDRWQEEHRAGGQLWDYKLGDSSTVDPRKQVGTWTVGSNAVTHTYSASTFSWSVHLISGTTYSFCNNPNVDVPGTEFVRAYIIADPGTGCATTGFPTVP